MVEQNRNELAEKRIGIVGLGLLGGSLAKALTKYTAAEVYGYARQQAVCDAAERDGAVRGAFTDMEQLIETVDVLFYALPPELIPPSVARYGHLLRPGMIVSDVASTKTMMMNAIYKVLPEGVAYVSVHPMAGSEKGGYEVAEEDLFIDHPWIVLRDEQHPAWNRETHAYFVDMGRTLGARIEELDVSEHDCLIARISHLPHAAAAMVMLVAGRGEEGYRRLSLAAGGFRDNTRVAGGNPVLWRDIFMSNKEEVRASLEELSRETKKLIDLLADDDGVGVEAYLSEAQSIRKIYEEIEEKKE